MKLLKFFANTLARLFKFFDLDMSYTEIKKITKKVILNKEYI